MEHKRFKVKLDSKIFNFNSFTEIKNFLLELKREYLKTNDLINPIFYDYLIYEYVLFCMENGKRKKLSEPYIRCYRTHNDMAETKTYLKIKNILDDFKGKRFIN